MSYIVESGASSSRRARRRRALVTLAVVALMLFFAFWYAYSYFRTSGKPSAAPPTTASCTVAPSAPKPQAITVNVYNATDRNGLAARTAAEVRKRGFKVSTVANDPLQKTVAAAAEVRYGRTATASGKVVLGLVRGATPVQDGRTDGSVDLVLGDKFTALVPTAKPPPAKPTTKSTTSPATGTGAAVPSASC